MTEEQQAVFLESLKKREARLQQQTQSGSNYQENIFYTGDVLCRTQKMRLLSQIKYTNFIQLSLLIQKKILPILKEYGVKRAAIFGSVSRGDNKSESDIDIMISLGKPIGMFAYMSLIRKMENRLGRKVDLVTENSINKFVRPYIQPDLKIIYER